MSLKEDELNYIFQALAHETRRKIIEVLGDKGPLTFTELMREAGVEETGTFGFHIKRIEYLLEKTGDGKYKLSKLGMQAYKIVKYSKGESVPQIKQEEGIKIYKGEEKVVVNKEKLEKYKKLGFKDIETLIFMEDVDPETFKEKVLFIEDVETIVVPRHLIRVLYSRVEGGCEEVIAYEGKVPERWLAITKKDLHNVKHINIYGTGLITRKMLESYKKSGKMIKINNYGQLIIDKDVTSELFDEVVYSIDSFGTIKAPPELFKVILEKTSTTFGMLEELE